MPDFILTPTKLLNPKDIRSVDLSQLGEGFVHLETFGGERETLTGPQAIEAVMALRPSALEGHRLKWPRHTWALHNLVGHPLMQLLAFVKLYKAAMWVHDVTVPKPKSV